MPVKRKSRLLKKQIMDDDKKYIKMFYSEAETRRVEDLGNGRYKIDNNPR